MAKRVVILLAAILFVSCKEIKIPPCVLEGNCLPSSPPSTLPAPPSPSPVPSVEPSLPPPSPEPSPSATPTPAPFPSPCVAKPACVDGCSSCAAYVQWALAGGHLARLPNGLLYNDPDNNPARRQYLDPKTCYFVNAAGQPNGKRYNRLREDGEVCADGCVKNAEPCPSPTPVPSPTPTPRPSPLPSGAPPLTESGNLPIIYLANKCENEGFSPTHEVGISVLSERECSGEPNCRVVNLNATEKSVKPYCEHSCYDEQGRYSLANCRAQCETLRECQQPEFVQGNTGILMQIKHPDWNNEWGVCDKRTAPCEALDCRANFLCHDRVVNRPGRTEARACMPDGTRCGPVKSY